MKMRVMETLRKYGEYKWPSWVLVRHYWCARLLSIRHSPQAHEPSCFADFHVDLEHDKAKFSVREPQFSTLKDSLRDPAFAGRGDIVGDQGVKFSILKRLPISRYSVRWFGHNDLEDMLPSAENERRNADVNSRWSSVVVQYIRMRKSYRAALTLLRPTDENAIRCARSSTKTSNSLQFPAISHPPHLHYYYYEAT